MTRPRCDIRRLGVLLIVILLVQLLSVSAFAEADAEAGTQSEEAQSATEESSVMQTRTIPAGTHPSLSPGVQNIVKRARQLTDIQWTPVRDIIGWKDREANIFHAGVSYTGIPYGQPHRSGSYVPWQTGFSEFLRQIANPRSPMYSERSVSQVKQNPSAYFCCECSAFVSWAWDLRGRETTRTLAQYGTLGGTNWKNLLVGDCLLLEGKHCCLVTDMLYDSDGTIIGIEISEEKEPAARRIWYLANDPYYPLTKLQTDFLDCGYVILRCDTRNEVGYSHSCAIPMERDFCPVCGCNPFEDVKLDAWYADSLAFVNNQGIMTGVSPNRFGPKTDVTRAMLVMMLWRMFHSPSTSAKHSFQDVKPGAYYEQAVNWAWSTGCVAGTSENSFSPNQSCTRAQLVTILWRAAGSPRPASTSCDFQDVKPDAYYYSALLWALENGIVCGKTETRFAPKDSATRAQTAQMIFRTCILLGLYG